MLHILASFFSDESIVFNVFRYITFRSFMALLTSMGIFFLFGNRWISWLRAKKLGQSVRTDGPESHLGKSGTPTMGGLLVLLSLIASVLIWVDLSSILVWGAIGVAVLLGLTGFWDDYRKITKRNSKGLSGRYKLVLQGLATLLAYFILYRVLGMEPSLQLPFFKTIHPTLGVMMPIFVFFVLAGASNAVNLTDGLDGLVSVPLVMAFSVYALFAYFAGNAIISDYLQLREVPGAGELSVVCAAAVGAVIGFLWYNAHPADVFMGDVGSLSLGGLLGYVALATKQEVLLVLVGVGIVTGKQIGRAHV